MVDPQKAKYQYYKIYLHIKSQIENGDFDLGQQLPVEAELQKHYAVSRDTIRKALRELELEGFITRRAAVGTFVRQKKSDYQLSSMTSFTEQMRSRGIEPSSQLERIELRTDVKSSIREQLLMKEGDRCYVISRVRKGNGTPMAYEKTYIPYSLCPNLQKYIDEEASLYEIYEDVYHLKIGSGRIRLEAAMPNAKLQAVLGLTKESPVLYMKCLGCLTDNTPFYYVDCYYIGEKYFFSTNVFRAGTQKGPPAPEYGETRKNV